MCAIHSLAQGKPSRLCPSLLEHPSNPILRIFILLADWFTSSRHRSKPEVHFLSGENVQESAFSCAIPPSCIICPIGPVDPNRSRQPTIQLCVRRRFRHGQERAGIHERLENQSSPSGETTTRSSLISSPKNQPATSLPLYGRDIPQALQDTSHRPSKTCPSFSQMSLP